MAKKSGKNGVTEVAEPQVESLRAKLSDINNLIKPYQLAYVSPTDDCELLQRNAHYMEKEMLDKLTSNVREDGFLSQLPFAMKKPDGKYLILSGNHRVRAAVKADLPYILILYVDQLPRDKQIAYQLSHNSLVGKDDLQMLKEIFAEIENINMKEFSGLNDLNFLELEKISLPSINEDDIELHELKLIFIKSKKDKIDKLFDALEKLPYDENSRLCLVDFKEFIRIMTEVKKRTKIKSLTVGVVKMLEICEKWLETVDQEKAITMN